MMFKSVVLAVVALAASASAYKFKGYGTAYSAAFDMDATGQNMCEYNPKKLSDRWNIFYGAMNEYQWKEMGGKSGICGKCIVARGIPGETTSGFEIQDVYVKIVDQCPDWACDRENVDFSKSALKAITGFPWDKKLITWEFVPCPDEAAAVAAAANKKKAVTRAQAKANAANKKASAAKDAARRERDAAQRDAANADTTAASQAAAKREAVANYKAAAASKEAAAAINDVRRIGGRRMV